MGTREIGKVREHIKCLYTNIDGMNALKGAELQVILNEVEPHIVFLTETKLSKDMVISQYLDCTDFSVFRRDRGKGRGGGVVILVRNGLWVSEISEQAWGGIEAVVCQAMIGQKALLLACI